MNRIPEEKLRELCAAIQGEWSLYVSIPGTGERLEIETGKRMVSASTIKIPLLALLLKDAEEMRYFPKWTQNLQRSTIYCPPRPVATAKKNI